MSMSDWARNEVRLAQQRENPKALENEVWDYGNACYESALNAYLSLMKDGHSGASFSITRSILIELLYGNPLTPIRDTQDVWGMSYKYGNKVVYQCKRRSSLFKEVYPNGDVKYTDNDRCYCINKNEPTISFNSGLVNKVIDEMYPITMPYRSNRPWKVITEEFLFDERNGDFDTVGIFELIKNEEVVKINRFFKEDENSKFVEISKQEYDDRRMVANRRKHG